MHPLPALVTQLEQILGEEECSFGTGDHMVMLSGPQEYAWRLFSQAKLPEIRTKVNEKKIRPARETHVAL
jgi:hypothetical protein